jgi:hypothetical protein
MILRKSNSAKKVDARLNEERGIAFEQRHPERLLATAKVLDMQEFVEVALARKMVQSNPAQRSLSRSHSILPPSWQSDQKVM